MLIQNVGKRVQMRSREEGINTYPEVVNEHKGGGVLKRGEYRGQGAGMGWDDTRCNKAAKRLKGRCNTAAVTDGTSKEAARSETRVSRVSLDRQEVGSSPE